MNLLKNSDITEELVKLKKKPTLRLGCLYHDEEDELDFSTAADEYGRILCAPFLTLPKDFGFLINSGLVFCDTEEEAWTLYEQVVGDDGPTKLNSYNGPWRMYAAIYDENGVCMTENT